MPAYLIAVVSAASLLGRRRAPVATMVATTLCGMLIAPLGLLPTPLTVAPAVISAYSLAVYAGLRTTISFVLPSAVLLVALTPSFEENVSWEDASRLVTVAAAPLVAALLGGASRQRRAYLAFMEERAVRAEETRDSEARRKVSEERVRIARELHDLVAHQITLANAQASVAARLFDTRPEQARASLDELVSTTRHALDDLRATVGLLRQRDDAPAPSEPAPGLGELPVLVDSFHRARLAVSVQHEGEARSLPPAVDLTAYRIIQEALTNVAKHSASGDARVQLTWDDEWVTITVVNDGGTPRMSRPESPGFGLIGLNERALAVGGELTASDRPDGGFIVTARLPLPTGAKTLHVFRSDRSEGP